MTLEFRLIVKGGFRASLDRRTDQERHPNDNLFLSLASNQLFLNGNGASLRYLLAGAPLPQIE